MLSDIYFANQIWYPANGNAARRIDDVREDYSHNVFVDWGPTDILLSDVCTTSMIESFNYWVTINKATLTPPDYSVIIHD